MALKMKGPPWWVKVPLYAALSPWVECRDFRVELHRRYLRAQQKDGIEAANRLARAEARFYFEAAIKRFGWWILLMIKMFVRLKERLKNLQLFA